MKDLPGPAAARRVDFNLEQLDERAAAGEDAVAFEQRLVLDGVEVEILREGVDQILVRHRRRKFRFGAHALDGHRQHGFEALPLMS